MKINKVVVFYFILLVLNMSCGNESSEVYQITEFTYNKTEGAYKNPLKGFNSGWWNDFDYATVGFQYLSWKEFEPLNGGFDFDAVEAVLDRPGTKGKHFILRLYCDWFGESKDSNAGPKWLYSDFGVARLENTDGKYVTNFNDPNFIKQAIEAIEVLAAHYDDDPRVYAFEIGILGYWGEWHTFGFGENFSINENSKNQIVNTYKDTFSNAKIMGRYPWREPLASIGGIGFHNDFFGPYAHSDEFNEAVDIKNKWLEGPIGGEAPPEFEGPQAIEVFGTTRGIEIIEKGHYSTMQAYSPCISSPDSEICKGFMKMHRKMGYNFQIENALFPIRLLQSEELTIKVNLTNIGVAPVYYDWDVQFALFHQDEQPITIYEVDYILSHALPGESFSLSASTPINVVDKGEYKLGLRIIQPGADQPKTNSWKLDARNTYILFSNELPVILGTWNTNHALLGGWSILGTLSVE
jgi:hypothetical protein